MTRRFTAHDLADYARCPRAWWYERHEALAQLDAHALEEHLRRARTARGRRSESDPEIQLILRLLERQARFAHGRTAHRGYAAPIAGKHRAGCLLPTLLLLVTLAIVMASLWP